VTEKLLERHLQFRHELARLVTEEYVDISKKEILEELIGATCTSCVFLGFTKEEILPIVGSCIDQAAATMGVLRSGISIAPLNNTVPEA
jgi:hypothetical protein